MPEFGYSLKAEGEYVKASAREVNVSPKATREVCKAIKGLRLDDARRFLEEVIAMKRAVPFRRYKKKVGHRSGLQGFYAGRYPVKAAKAVLRVLENLEANAEFKGMDLDRLVIFHAAAYPGMKIKDYFPRAFGRSSPNFRTLVHIELAGREK